MTNCTATRDRGPYHALSQYSVQLHVLKNSLIGKLKRSEVRCSAGKAALLERKACGASFEHTGNVHSKIQASLTNLNYTQEENDLEQDCG